MYTVRFADEPENATKLENIIDATLTAIASVRESSSNAGVCEILDEAGKVVRTVRSVGESWFCVSE